MRILLVEDSVGLSKSLSAILTKEKYTVDAVLDGKEGYLAAQSNIYDLIILDVMLPNMDGFTILKKIRQEKVTSPVIMLTALGTEPDKIRGLDGGADDYLAKPFSVPELLARVRALLRRKGEMVLDDKLSYKNISLNLATHSMSNEQGASITLSQKEFELLRCFFENKGAVLDKEALITKVWGWEGEFESNNVEAFISFIRKKLSHLGAEFTIVAQRNVGYQLGEKKA